MDVAVGRRSRPSESGIRGRDRQRQNYSKGRALPADTAGSPGYWRRKQTGKKISNELVRLLTFDGAIPESFVTSDMVTRRRTEVTARN